MELHTLGVDGGYSQKDVQEVARCFTGWTIFAPRGGAVATQAMSSNYVEVVDGRGEYRSIPFRYVWPAELDLMAQLAGLRLRERWSGWTGDPFTAESRRHVSIWEKPRNG